MQIRPQETFPILYLISDPSDTNTYYVRSVMRNSATGAVINIGNKAYVNLIVSPTNSRRFSTKIQAPGDPGNTGTWIDITTTVYTDAAYTVKSAVYMEACDKYLIQERWTTAYNGGGGWSTLALEEHLGRAFKKSFGELPTTEIPSLDLTPVLAGHEAIKNAIAGIKVPEPAQVDLETPLFRAVEALRKEIKAIKVPNVDLRPVLRAIERIEPQEQAEQKDYDEQFAALKEMVLSLKGDLPRKYLTDFMREVAAQTVPKMVEKSPYEVRAGKLMGEMPEDIKARAKNLHA